MDNIVRHERFTKLIMFIIFLNTIVLAIEHYDSPDWLGTLSDVTNYIFTIVFALEMILRLFGMGIREYCKDYFNVFDGVIVIISLVELFFATENSGLSVLRAFRLTRVFKIIKSWKDLRVLLTTVMNSFSAIANLGVLTILFLFISALLAK